MVPYLCGEACHAVGPGAALRQALCQQAGGQAVVRHGQGHVTLQQVSGAAAFPVVETERGGGQTDRQTDWSV